MAIDRFLDLKNNRYIYVISIIALIIALFFIGLYYVSSSVNDASNNATRADLSHYVSNKPCGLEYPDEGCPGELECHNGLYSRHRSDNISGFNISRVGANVTEARCVAPMYKKRYCGPFEGAATLESYPPYRSPCYSYSSTGSKISKLIGGYTLYDRIFNTPERGEEMIRKHGLSLAKEEPETDEIVSELNVSIKYSPNTDELTINFVETSFNRSSDSHLSIIAKRPRFEPENVILRYNETLYNTSHIAGTEESATTFPLEGKEVTMVKDGINPGEGNEGVYSPEGELFMTYYLAWNSEHAINKPIAKFGYLNETWQVKYLPHN